jgi:hypothetical protein
LSRGLGPPPSAIRVGPCFKGVSFWLSATGTVL